jgi:Tfp pilus assembly protein PilF
MLTTKNQARIFPTFVVALAFIFLSGCADRGSRALLEGEQFIKQGSFNEAIRKLTEAVDLLPQNAQAWNHLGLAYQYAGQPGKAAEQYQQALRLDRNLGAAHFNLGIVLMETNFAAAAEEFASYSRVNPQDVNGWLKLGAAQLRQAIQLTGNEKARWLDAAKRNLDVAFKLKPTAEALNSLGMIEVQRGRPRDGIKQFSAALQTQPNYPPALLNLAIVYQNLNDRRSALQKYREYLAAQPRNSRLKQVEEIARGLDVEINPPVVTNSVARPATSTPTKR